MMDELLKKYNLKYEDLKPEERETFHTWLSALEQSQLTIEKIRDFITAMKNSIEQELAKSDVNTKDDVFLKARLRNVMLFEAFLSTPQRARQQLERSLSGVKKS